MESAHDFAGRDDPFQLFEDWLGDATKSEINDPNGMALATVDAEGLPNVRMVLLKGLDAAGVPGARLRLLHQLWKRQGARAASRSEGGAPLPLEEPQAAGARAWACEREFHPEEADEYYASRPRLSRIGAWASDQSRPLDGRFELESALPSTPLSSGLVKSRAHRTGRDFG